MKDPISQMSEEEIRKACCEIVCDFCNTKAALVGLIIDKLQDWNCSFSLRAGWNIDYENGFSCSQNLQEAFLKTALALGHWNPPQKKVELTLEERVAPLETFIAKISEQFPNTKNL